MKCLMKYQWVKLPRNIMPHGKGIMGSWARLASRAAFRKGQSTYCGFKNDVVPGMWSGGMVGVKSILGTKKRAVAQETLDRLVDLGYISYTLDRKTKKLDYQITDWVVKCSGAECMDGAVYTTTGYGFLCMPRSITQRLVDKHYKFEEADAWLDLWCHTVCNDKNNIFSFMAPAIQYGKHGAILTLETLGKRWGWEKTKVWRFLKKNSDAFTLYKLPGSFGCLIFNKLYPTGKEVSLPEQAEVLRVLNQIREMATNSNYRGSDNLRICKAVHWYSYDLAPKTEPDPVPPASEQEPAAQVGESCPNPSECGVAESAPIIRVYISLCRNCKSYYYDCMEGKLREEPPVFFPSLPVPPPIIIPEVPFY